MPVVAVVNRKGGSGKSTLATHLAGYCANSGLRVMLGDVDRQQSSLAWLRRRATQALARSAPIVGWAVDTRSVLRPPSGITHVVLDTPGGLRGLDLARVVMNADAIVMPVCSSAFDRESAVECHAELMALPRVASGRCKVAVVGMRLDARTSAGALLESWAARHKIPYVGALRETQAYVRCVEQGLTLFDLPAGKVQSDLAQWQPILAWLDASWQASKRPDGAKDPVAAAPAPVHPPSAPSPARESHAMQERVQRAVRPSLADHFGRLFAAFRSSN
jgi:chromosome partitioning protein